MKVGIIRCLQTEDYCPASTCLAIAKSKGGIFKEAQGSVEVVGVVSCGGCPGKRTAMRAKELVRRGADTIALASCIFEGTPIGFPCPNANLIKQVVTDAVGSEVAVLLKTH